MGIIVNRTLRAYPDSEYKQGATPLHLASKTGDESTPIDILTYTPQLIAEQKKSFTRLHLAAKQGDVDTLKILLKQGSNVNAEDEYGTTPLHLAVEQSNDNTLKVQLDHKANVNAEKTDGTTPLHLPANQWNTQTLKLLLDHQANVNAKDWNGTTPLHLAAGKGNDQALKALLDHSAKVNAADKNGNTPLHLAVQQRNETNLTVLLDHKANVNARDNDGLTALHLAAEQKSDETVSVLIDHKANVNAKDKDGITPLHLAANNGDGKTLIALLDHKANVNAKDKDGTTPLHLAAACSNDENLEVLLSHGANVNAEDKGGVTSLHLAAAQLSDTNLKLLINHKGNVNAQDKDGATPLHFAIKDVKVPTLNALLRQRADINAQDKNGRTPLHLAIEYANVTILNVLLRHGASVNNTPDIRKDSKTSHDHTLDVDVADCWGQTPLHVAAMKGRLEAAECLLKHGASVNSRDKTGNTPLDKAISAGHTGIVTLLTSYGKSDDVAVSSSTGTSAEVNLTGMAASNKGPDAEYSDDSSCSGTSYSDISASASLSENSSHVFLEGDMTSSEKELTRNYEDASAPVQGTDCLQKDQLQSEKRRSNLRELLTVTDWQTSFTCFAAGGMFRKLFSDVILIVPACAVEENMSVAINTAVGTDLDRISHVLQLPDTEEIVSPMAEYSTDPPGFHFTKHVCIQMPHFLQPDFDPSLLQVYHVTRGSDGQVNKTSLKLYHGTHVRTEQNENTAGVADDMSSYAQVAEDGKINIYTDKFCGFVCTYCDKKKKLLQLFAMVKGSFDWAPKTYPLINISVYIWDGRITIVDFTQLYGFEPSKDMILLNLLDELRDTRLDVRLRLTASSGVRFSQDENGRPLVPIETYFDLPQRLCCKKCQVRGRKLFPMTYRWELEPQSTISNPRFVSVAVDITHATTAKSPTKERVTFTKLTVNDNTVAAEEHMSERQREQWRQQLLTLTTAELEAVGKSIATSPLVLQDLRDRTDDEVDYMMKLSEWCVMQKGFASSTPLISLVLGPRQKQIADQASNLLSSPDPYHSSRHLPAPVPEAVAENGHLTPDSSGPIQTHAHQNGSAIPHDGMNFHLREYHAQSEARNNTSGSIDSVSNMRIPEEAEMCNLKCFSGSSVIDIHPESRNGAVSMENGQQVPLVGANVDEDETVPKRSY